MAAATCEAGEHESQTRVMDGRNLAGWLRLSAISENWSRVPRQRARGGGDLRHRDAPLKLLKQRLDMVGVNVRVTQHVN